MNIPVEGSCQCGKIKYKLNEEPIKVLACHCTECQKLSTSPFSVSAFVNSNAIEFNGELSEWIRTAESGNKNHAKFCPTCGTRIYHFNPNKPEIVVLKLKPVNLPDDTLFEPSAHIWVSQKLSWFEIPKGIPTFEKQP